MNGGLHLTFRDSFVLILFHFFSLENNEREKEIKKERKKINKKGRGQRNFDFIHA
jgi:hypothetical protein